MGAHALLPPRCAPPRCRRTGLIIPALAMLAALALAAPSPAPNDASPLRPPTNATLAELEIRLIGKNVNDSAAFVEVVDDALATSVDWLSVDDMRRTQAVTLLPCNVAPAPPGVATVTARGRSRDKKADTAKKGGALARAPARARAPPPPPRRALRQAMDSSLPPAPSNFSQVDGCKMLTMRFAISPLSPPTQAAFARLPGAIHSGRVADIMAAMHVPVDGVDLLDLRVQDNLFAPDGDANGFPAAATGRNVVRFRLRISGPDAVFGRQDMLRDLLLGITEEFTQKTDYVGVANTRLVKVSKVEEAMDDDPITGGRRRRRLAQAVAPTTGADPDPAALPAPAPADADAPAPAPRAATRGGLPSLTSNFEFDYQGALVSPPLETTVEVLKLPAAGVRAVYGEAVRMSETGGYTRMLTDKGYRIDSVVAAPEVDWFTVNQQPFAGGHSIMDLANLGDVRPLAATVAIPLALLLAALIAAACVWHRRQHARGRNFWGRSTRVESLAAAVSAARKGDTASAAAMLLGDPAAAGGASKLGPAAKSGGIFDRLANDWQIDPASIEISKDKSGAQIVLGSGAAGTVYRGMMNGVQDVAIKVFKEPLAALAAAASGGLDAAGGGGRVPGLRGFMAWRRPSTDGRLTGSGGSGPPGARPSGSGRGPRPRQSGSAHGGGARAAAASAAAASPPSDDTAAADRGRALRPSPSTVDDSAGGGGCAPSVDASDRSPVTRSAAAARQLEELAREVVLMRACRDRNLVGFVGACVAPGGHAVIVSDLMPNGDLYNALAGADGRRFGWRRALGPGGRPLPNTGLSRRVALDIARGLAYLHSRGVVHLDLKSPNVLLSRAWEAKIADYGVSRVLRDRYVSTLPTAAGTLVWAAPEVLLGRPVSEKADIYSFGVVLWELSSGEPPRGRAVRPLDVPDEAPQVVVDMIARCMSEEPTERPSAADLVAFFKSMDDDGAVAGGAAAVAATAKSVMRKLSSRTKTDTSAAASSKGGSFNRSLSGAPSPAGVIAEGGPAAVDEAPPRAPAMVPSGGFAAAAAAQGEEGGPAPATHARAGAPPPCGPQV